MQWKIDWKYYAAADYFSGSVWVVEGDTADEARANLIEQLSRYEFVQPFHEHLLECDEPYAIIGNFRYADVVRALKTLSPAELQTLMDDVMRR